MRTLTECTELSKRELDVLQMAKERILQLYPEAELILFGSRARGDAEEDSDYDVAVIRPEPLHWQERDQISDMAVGIELQTGKYVSVRCFSRKQWESYAEVMPLMKEIRKDGVPF